MAARKPRRCGTALPRVVIDGRWANPPFALVQRIYQESRRSVPSHGRDGDSDIVDQQGWLRRVSAVFHKRLRKASIYVGGT